MANCKSVGPRERWVRTRFQTDLVCRAAHCARCLESWKEGGARIALQSAPRQFSVWRPQCPRPFDGGQPHHFGGDDTTNYFEVGTVSRIAAGNLVEAAAVLCSGLYRLRKNSKISQPCVWARLQSCRLCSCRSEEHT